MKLVKPPKMTVVDGRGFDEIVSDMAEHLARVVKEYGLSQKMATKLVHDAWAQVEQQRMCREDPEVYIREHLDAQIDVYISSGVHTLVGYTEEEFRDALMPLVQKTVNFFAPPAGHPIIDGEFTCFLVIPPEWGLSLRSLIGRLRTPSLLLERREILERVAQGGEVAAGGCAAPQTPYILVGVKGGRGLTDYSRASANKEREKFGFSYFSAYQLALLLLLHPEFLLPGERAIALGEKFPERQYLEFASFQDGFLPYLLLDPSPSSLEGIGKPYYTRMITL